MSITVSIEQLGEELNNTQNNLCMYLQTDRNLYSFRSDLSEQQQLDIINPINDFLLDKEFVKYDAYERRVNNIYYITEGMQEFESLNKIFICYDQIQNGHIDRATIRAIQDEKIKLIIFQKGNFLFLYRYNASKLFTEPVKNFV